MKYNDENYRNMPITGEYAEVYSRVPEAVTLTEIQEVIEDGELISRTPIYAINTALYINTVKSQKIKEIRELRNSALSVLDGPMSGVQRDLFFDQSNQTLIDLLTDWQTLRVQLLNAPALATVDVNLLTTYDDIQLVKITDYVDTTGLDQSIIDMVSEYFNAQ